MKNKKISLLDGLDNRILTEWKAQNYLWEQSYEKNQTVFRRGEVPDAVGILLYGRIHIESTDFTGNKNILSHVEPGEIFAEAYALAASPMMVDAVTAEPSRILFVKIRALSREAASFPDFFSKLLHLCAQKNLHLSERMLCTGAKSARQRIISYLSAEALRQKSNQITLPFNRQEMADYLNLDRSALSKELGRMRDKGILAFHKNEFTLLRFNE